MSELRERLELAALKLEGLAARAASGSAHQERLYGKAQGVRLALSYLDEEERANA